MNLLVSGLKIYVYMIYYMIERKKLRENIKWITSISELKDVRVVANI